MISRVAPTLCYAPRLYVAPASCSAPCPHVARYHENWVSCSFYNYDAGIAKTLQRRDVELLFSFDFC